MTTTEPSKPRSRRRFAAFTLGLVLAPVAAEVGYRVLRVSSLSPTTNPLYVVHDDELGWRYAPNSIARHTTAEFDVEIAINSDGFRGPDWPGSKRGQRVLVLGDSFAFGWGVRDEETFAARLRRAHPEWEVLNVAVSGYATDQELLLLRRLRERADPDVVVCVFCPNDLMEASSDVVYGKSKPRFSARGPGLALENVPVPRSWLERTSALWRAWKKTRWERANRERVFDAEKEWELVLALFETMRAELAPVPLVIVSGEERLARFSAERVGTRHVDVRPGLESSPAPTGFPIDGHWNAHGHELVSRALASEIARALATALEDRR